MKLGNFAMQALSVAFRVRTEVLLLGAFGLKHKRLDSDGDEISLVIY